ncbi:MAG: ACP S-malonyltransferase [Leptospiraceae bacterium]|nr:ACP S-malonyltransferase [Leptospiraceae bacterium]
MSELLKQAEAGNARFYLQFGGQGAPWIKELAAYYGDDKFKQFFDVVLGAIEAERPRVDGSIGLPHGIDARSWLENADSIPGEDYLATAAVSIPMIQVTQLAHVENLRQNGFPLEKMLQYTVAATGHSQGLIPACLMAQDLSGKQYLEGLEKYVKYLLYLGVSAQKAYPYFAPTQEEISASEELGGSAPAPMVAVLGESHEYIQGLVDAINPDLPKDQQIYISLYNSPANRILSSFRSSLIAFHRKYNTELAEKKIKFVYLRTTCPFHCALMKSIRDIFEPEIKHIGFTYTGADLKRPVYSFVDGVDMATTGERLPIKMYEDMAIEPLYWHKSVSPGVLNAQVTHFLDFGPGKTSQRLSMDVMKDLGTEKEVLAAGVPKDVKKILA